VRIRSRTDNFAATYDGTADLPRHVVWSDQERRCTFESLLFFRQDAGHGGGVFRTGILVLLDWTDWSPGLAIET